MHLITGEELAGLFRAGGTHCDMVFVSACHSQTVAEALIRSGVASCAVAVRTDHMVTDRASFAFSSSFYSALLGGHSIAQARRRVAPL